MSLAQVRHEIAGFYRGELDAKVIEYEGTFDMEALQRVAVQAPAVVVSCTGVPKFERQGPVVVGHATWAAITVATKRGRAAEALALMESVAAHLPFQRWNDTASRPPEGIAAANMHSAALEKMGVSMWAVRWTQAVDLSREALAELDTFAKLYGDIPVPSGIVGDTIPTQDHAEIPQ